MSIPVAIRFDEVLVEEVRRIARGRGSTLSSVVQGFAEEGVRGCQVPGIVFRDGPAGRRASVAGSLDVWEIVEAAQEVGTMNPATLGGELGVSQHVIQVALDYYSRYPDDIDQWITDNQAEAEKARAAWQRLASTGPAHREA